jgi:hypothetical protein
MKTIIIITVFFVINIQIFANDRVSDSEKDNPSLDTPFLFYNVGLGLQGFGVISINDVFNSNNITGCVSLEFPFASKGQLSFESGLLIWKNTERELIKNHFNMNLFDFRTSFIFTTVCNYYSKPFGENIRPKVFVGFINLIPIDFVAGIGCNFKLYEYSCQVNCTILSRSNFDLSIDSKGPTKSSVSSLINFVFII